MGTYHKYEHRLIRYFTKTGGKYYASAGNDNINLDKAKDKFYPAAYPGVIAVGAYVKHKGKFYRAKYSNYGKKTVTRWGNGYSYNKKYSGTSFACPRVVAKDEQK